MLLFISFLKMLIVGGATLVIVNEEICSYRFDQWIKRYKIYVVGTLCTVALIYFKNKEQVDIFSIILLGYVALWFLHFNKNVKRRICLKKN